jgi:hypothetical protein
LTEHGAAREGGAFILGSNIMNTEPTDVWVFKTSEGDAAYERPDGTYYLRRANGSIKAISKFEIQRFISSLADQKVIEDAVNGLEATLEAIGVKLPKNVRKTVIANTHKEARAKGLVRSSSVVTKIFDE